VTILVLIGWVIVYSLWQGMIIACAAALAFCLARSALMRYRIACSALTLIAICAASTPILITRATRDDVTFTAPVNAENAVVVPIPGIYEISPERSASTPTPSSASRKINWNVPSDLPRWIGIAWCVAVAIPILRYVHGMLQLRRLRQCSTPLIDPDFSALFASVHLSMGVRRNVLVLSNSAIDAPCTMGWLKPVILWPSHLVHVRSRECSDELGEREAVLSHRQVLALLRHELAHVRRSDYLINCCVVAIETIFFYHPAVWWLSQYLRREREYCCDDMAASFTKNRLEYAAALVQLETMRIGARLALHSNGGSLMQRISRLCASDHPVPDRALGWRAFVSIMLLASAVVVTIVLQTHALPAAASQSAEANTQTTTQSTTTKVASNVSDYKLQPGDVVRVSVWGLFEPGRETTLVKRVSESGTISVPIIGLISLSGHTEVEAESVIRRRVDDLNQRTDSQASVTALSRGDRLTIISIKDFKSEALPEKSSRIENLLLLAESRRLLIEQLEDFQGNNENRTELEMVLRSITRDLRESCGGIGEVRVTGDIRRAGVYGLMTDRRIRLRHMYISAGGSNAVRFPPNGTWPENLVEINRSSQQVTIIRVDPVTLKEVELRREIPEIFIKPDGDPDGDLLLEPGDTLIFHPAKSRDAK